MQAKPKNELALVSCGVEAHLAPWIGPYIFETLKTLAQTDSSCSWEDTKDFFDLRWKKCGVPFPSHHPTLALCHLATLNQSSWRHLATSESILPLHHPTMAAWHLAAFAEHP